MPPLRTRANGNWFRGLSAQETTLAKTVFADTLPYGRIFIGNINSPTGAITVATDPVKERASYILVWGEVYNGDATRFNFGHTFIHELTHVWQSQYAGFAMAFMAESVWAQLRSGVKDIFRDGIRKGVENIEEMIKKRDVSQWNQHRGKAYAFSMSEVGKPWGDFNVEQQACIVHTWFRDRDYGFSDGTVVPGGKRSPKDPRYPYIEHNIRARSNSAAYVPAQNPHGYSPEIAEIQSVLFALGYLKDQKYVDGFMGRITRDAVREFQRRNKLKDDGDIGGPNSETRKKLRLPFDQLGRAQ